MKSAHHNARPFYLGKYVLFPQKLGEGSYGEIFFAKDPKGTILAAKSIPNKNIISSSDSKQHIINEITLYYKLNHRNIIKLKDILLTQDNTYLLLEYCNCENLLEFMNNYKRIFMHNPTLKVTQIIFAQIIEGLYYMSTQQCAHRDLKLENIMLSENLSLNMSINMSDQKIESYISQDDIKQEKYDNKLYFNIPQMKPKYWDNEFIKDEKEFENHLKNYVVKIIDLGLGKKFTNDLLTTSVCGNFFGVAPEMWKILKRDAQCYCGTKVDLWSLGVMLFIFVFNQSPFNAKSIIQLISQYDNGIYTLPTAGENTVTVEFLDLLNGLLRLEPQERYDWDVVKNHPFIRKPIEQQRTFKLENSDTLTLDIINNSQQFLTEEELHEYRNLPLADHSQPSEENKQQNVEFRRYLVDLFKYNTHIVVPMETTITQIDKEWSLIDNKILENPQKPSVIDKIFSYFYSSNN